MLLSASTFFFRWKVPVSLSQYISNIRNKLNKEKKWGKCSNHTTTIPSILKVSHILQHIVFAQIIFSIFLHAPINTLKDEIFRQKRRLSCRSSSHNHPLAFGFVPSNIYALKAHFVSHLALYSVFFICVEFHASRCRNWQSARASEIFQTDYIGTDGSEH